MLARLTDQQVRYNPTRGTMTQVVTDALGTAGTNQDGFDAMWNDLLGTVDGDSRSGVLDGSELDAAAFVAGDFERSTLQPITSDIASFQAAGDVLIGETTPTPTPQQPTQGTLGILTDVGLPPAVVNHAYRTQLSATGGTKPYAWSLVKGALPVGCSMSADGVISGTPTVPGNTFFTAQVTDSATPTNTAQRDFVLRIVGPHSLGGGGGPDTPGWVALEIL